MKLAARMVVALLVALLLVAGAAPAYQATDQPLWQTADPNPPEGG